MIFLNIKKSFPVFKGKMFEWVSKNTLSVISSQHYIHTCDVSLPTSLTRLTVKLWEGKGKIFFFSVFLYIFLFTKKNIFCCFCCYSFMLFIQKSVSKAEHNQKISLYKNIQTETESLTQKAGDPLSLWVCHQLVKKSRSISEKYS